MVKMSIKITQYKYIFMISFNEEKVWIIKCEIFSCRAINWPVRRVVLASSRGRWLSLSVSSSDYPPVLASHKISLEFTLYQFIPKLIILYPNTAEMREVLGSSSPTKEISRGLGSRGGRCPSLEASFARCFTFLSNIDKKLHC